MKIWGTMPKNEITGGNEQFQGWNQWGWMSIFIDEQMTGDDMNFINELFKWWF